MTTQAEFGVLEPLCEATESALKKPRLRDGERLYIWMNNDGTKFVVELRVLRPDGSLSSYRPSSGAQEVIRFRVPESTWLGKKDPTKAYRWLCAATDYTALVLAHAFGPERIHFGIDDTRHSEDAETLFRLLGRRFLSQEHTAQMQARYKLNKEVPREPELWRDHPERPLAPYQKTATILSLGQSYALFMDPGTGKTATSVQRICMEALAQEKMSRVLIVVPPQVMLNWKREIMRFSVTNGKVVILRGGPTKRVKQLIQGITTEKGLDYSCVIVSYDSAVASIEELERIPWNLVIADESHYFKSAKTRRWRDCMLRLRDCSDQRLILTGSPIGNTPFDLWTQLEFLYEGASGFSTREGFRRFYGRFVEAGGGAPQGAEKLVGLKNLPLLQERLARLSFSITKKEAGLNLPDKVYDEYEVEMTSRQTEFYKKIGEELRLEIEDKLSGNVVDEIIVEHILTQLLRLAQITSGHVVWQERVDPDTLEIISEKRVEQINIRNPKVEAIVQMLQDEQRDPKGKMIVWCRFVPDIVALSKRLDELNIRHVLYYGAVPKNLRDDNVDGFNQDPECRVFIGNPQSAGAGLDLLGYDKEDPENSETYVDHMVFMSQGWSAIERTQAEDRAHRRGTRTNVRITDLVVAETIDEEIRVRVLSKRVSALSILDVRDILKKVVTW